MCRRSSLLCLGLTLALTGCPTPPAGNNDGGGNDAGVGDAGGELDLAKPDLLIGVVNLGTRIEELHPSSCARNSSQSPRIVHHQGS